MITTNTGAKKLESSDNWREIFPNPGTGTAGAHNASVDAQDRIQAEVAPIINGKQCALGAASGDYVLLRNSTITGKTDGAYIATKAIPANTDIDSTYLGSPITGGMVNELNNNLTKCLVNKYNSTYEIRRIGNVCCYTFAGILTSTSGTLSYSIPNGYKPADWYRGSIHTDNGATWGKMDINPATGEVEYSVQSANATYYGTFCYITNDAYPT